MGKSSHDNFIGGHQASLIRSGEQFFAAVENIVDEAERYIHFHTYIIDEDSAGKRIVAALIRAAKRGVRVYLLLDAFGTKFLSDEFIDSIEESGILFRFFAPVFVTKNLQLSLRLHSKVVLVDGEVAIIGGINIADRYLGKEGKLPWLDFAVKIRGPECGYVLDICRKNWNKAFLGKEKRSLEKIEKIESYPDNVRLKVNLNNWYRNKMEISRNYRSMLRFARKRITIFASYFLPGSSERKLLARAAERGIDIKIVLAADSDIPVFKKATHFLYDFILRNKIRIYEYQPANLHAKVAVADGKWSTIGSYNMNRISDYASIEVNVGILDEPFTLSFEEILNDIIANDCKEITIKENRRRSIFSRFMGWAAYLSVRLVMRVLVQMTMKKRKR